MVSQHPSQAISEAQGLASKSKTSPTKMIPDTSPPTRKKSFWIVGWGTEGGGGQKRERNLREEHEFQLPILAMTDTCHSSGLLFNIYYVIKLDVQNRCFYLSTCFFLRQRLPV